MTKDKKILGPKIKLQNKILMSFKRKDLFNKMNNNIVNKVLKLF